VKKKKSLREKGNDFQIWIKNWLQERGWTVRNFPMTSKAITIPIKKGSKVMKLIWVHQNNDVFGSDLIAIKGRVRLWIQASLDEHISRRTEEYSKYFTALGPYEALMIWIKRANWKSIKKVIIGTTGQMIVADLGKIQAGKFTPAKGMYLFDFGEKIKKEKKKK